MHTQKEIDDARRTLANARNSSGYKPFIVSTNTTINGEPGPSFGQPYRAKPFGEGKYDTDSFKDHVDNSKPPHFKDKYAKKAGSNGRPAETVDPDRTQKSSKTLRCQILSQPCTFTSSSKMAWATISPMASAATLTRCTSFCRGNPLVSN
jgi:hypothetical protein